MTLPATAVLASSLLQPTSHAQSDSDAADERHEQSARWDLTRDIDIGVTSLSDCNVFSCGRVVGISGLQLSSCPEDEAHGDGDIKDWVGELSLHILANTLVGKSLSDSSYPRALVVQFLDSRPISPDSLYHSAKERLPDQHPEEIKALISRVQVYQTFEFHEILEAVTRISDMLYNIQQQKKATLPTEEISGPSQLEAAERSYQEEEPRTRDEPVLVILEGIDQSLEEIIRASNALAGRAKLITLLRTLTTLSRTYASFLTIIVANAISLPPVPGGQHQDPDHLANPAAASGQNGPDHEPRRFETPYHQQPSHPFIPVQSVFEKTPESNVSETSSLASFSRPVASYPSTLARSLDQGFDTHLLVSRAKGRMVIEVAKDRVGINLGRWCAL